MGSRCLVFAAEGCTSRLSEVHYKTEWPREFLLALSHFGLFQLLCSNQVEGLIRYLFEVCYDVRSARKFGFSIECQIFQGKTIHLELYFFLQAVLFSAIFSFFFIISSLATPNWITSSFRAFDLTRWNWSQKLKNFTGRTVQLFC